MSDTTESGTDQQQLGAFVESEDCGESSTDLEALEAEIRSNADDVDQLIDLVDQLADQITDLAGHVDVGDPDVPESESIDETTTSDTDSPIFQ